ncbi:hypothetical protein BDV96DRAFT_574445 [Lophiotrema nucula]|uniref:ER-bound oxygenase mpaB/mpaB'/Rubber oxygenase catalytic domain-containing protein n=1 Tax=Lophiotrema nucula TaxID=690887 RepID=A0A6A5ZAP7_9PLEO|nr:hypothetical protein BDV96DRAFT_574445 [Lophiotrema nucula]
MSHELIMNSSTSKLGSYDWVKAKLSVDDDTRLTAPFSWPIVILTVTVAYLTLVQLLRCRAIRQMERKYATYMDNPYRLNYKQAREIMQLSLLHDFPFLFGFGTQWALIKSYGIATGTPLLVKTRQLANPATAGKRAEDTGVLIGEFLVGDIDNERGRLAMSKLNWMHRRYKILEGDYVHTLALFVLEPQLWIEKYEWRPMTYLEKAAQLVYWREIGARMGFGGIPETLEELAEWKTKYEKKHLYYIEANRIVTEATLQIFLRQTPKYLHGFVRNLFISFIEEKNVRDALGFPDPPAWATFLTTNFFRIRGFLIRHFFLPRLHSLDPLPKQGADSRYHRDPHFILFEPWYVADTWYNRLVLWTKSAKPGPEFKSSGYLPEELGPAGTERAKDSVHKQAEAMKEYVQRGGAVEVGCPFKFGW